MGLIDRARAVRYMYTWRVRYWWMDTTGGRRAHIVALCIGVLLVIIQMARLAVAALVPPPPGAPMKAIYWWVIQLIILVVAAAVAYALKPDPPKAAERKVESPTVEDGTPIKDHGGTVWIEHDDNRLLAWKVVGRDAIKSDSGK
ncbi:MAG: hypothetical protein ACREO4_16340 [Lysobacter sp.]